ncbi:MAG: AAA domain-containing protein [Alphaproteobacteria bacterium]|jgi:MoxR-like ATPase|nr:AAA domain-containing protein [Alphaproteobacteria bacterium]
MSNGLNENPFVRLKPETEMDLPGGDRFAAAGHLWGREEIDALIAAWAARRPLLVRGEAGCGKSQIARAAATVLGDAEPLVEVIHPRFEALDLLYHVDVVARLSDAQIAGALDPTNEKYVKRGRLWEAMDRLKDGTVTPVLLVDEIDKADADVPNALLDVLGNRSFTVPPLGNRTVAAPDKRLPLVIITTNEERELPAAFVRRCMVLNLDPPAGKGPFIDWLVRRGRVHRHLDIADDARAEAAAQVHKDRQAALAAGYPAVGLAEYVDLLTALHDLTRGEPEETRAEAQIGWLQRIAPYALVKHAGQRQAAPEAEEA